MSLRPACTIKAPSSTASAAYTHRRHWLNLDTSVSGVGRVKGMEGMNVFRCQWAAPSQGAIGESV